MRLRKLVLPYYVATLLLLFGTSNGCFAQSNALSPERRAELNALAKKNPSQDNAQTCIDIAYLVNEDLRVKNIVDAQKLVPRLCRDILMLPDEPFDYWHNCALSAAICGFERLGYDRDAQQIVRSCFNKLARCKSGTTSPVAIDVAWFTDAFRENSSRYRAVKELWLSTIEKVNGPNSDATAFVCDRRAELLLADKRGGEAMPMIKQTAAILSRATPPANPEAIKAGCYAIALRGMDFEHAGDTGSAEKVYRIAIDLGNALNTEKECKPVDASLWLCWLYYRTHRVEKARDLLRLVGAETVLKLPAPKKNLAPYVDKVIRECLELDEYEAPGPVLTTIVYFSSWKKDLGTSIELQLSNAFAGLDDGDMACETWEQVIAIDKQTQNNASCLASDMEHYRDLLELKKKHVSHKAYEIYRK